MKLPSQDSATGRGLKTAVFTVGGFLVGLFIVVWKVEGVPQAVINYVQGNALQLALGLGVPTAISSGILSFVYNFFRSNVKNY